MTLFEFTDLCDLNVVIYHAPNAVSHWIAKIGSDYREVSFKTGPLDIMLGSCCGWGDTPENALRDLIKNLEEYSTIVIDPIKGMSEGERKKINIPKSITL